MSKYTRKQKSKGSDEFVGFWEKVYTTAAPYARKILIVITTTLVIVFAAWGIINYREHRAESAAEAFGRAVKIYDADLISDLNPAPAKSDEENPIPRFKTEKERADAALAELDALEKKWGSTDAAKNALIFRAGIQYDQGRWDESAKLYQKAAERADKDPSVAAVAHEGVGLCAEAQNKLDDALAAYKAMEPKSGDFYRDRALYDQARVYLKKGDKKKAGDLYKEVLAKMPTSQLRDEIQNQLAQLEGT
ncbi:MAG TPA: tetratricopeptide repeat protein [Polyangia bacterium]|nr:tetratricopeptide repeat protein [Polyangia bacterium]